MGTSLAFTSDTFFWSCSRIALGIRRRRPRSQRKNASARSSSVLRRAIPDARSSSGVVGGLVLLMANRLDLEGAVRDVEVPAKTFAQPIEHLTGATLANAGVVHDDVRRQDRYAAGNRPGGQVVDSPTYLLDVRAYFGEVHAVRRSFQKYVHDLTEQ